MIRSPPASVGARIPLSDEDLGPDAAHSPTRIGRADLRREDVLRSDLDAAVGHDSQGEIDV
jgi:hypothetical protein